MLAQTTSPRSSECKTLRILLLCVCCFFAAAASAQSASYDTLVQKGKLQLKAGSNELALSTAKAAIKLDPNRWEAYVVAGGALMNMKQYEDAADRFSKAIELAPEAKKAGLRDLRHRCFNPQPGADASAPAEGTTSQAEVVLWKSIEKSSDPSDFQSYLTQYPNGAFAPLARTRLDKLSRAGDELKSEMEDGEQILNDIRSHFAQATIGSKTPHTYTPSSIKLNGSQLTFTYHEADSAYWGYDQTCEMTIPLNRISQDVQAVPERVADNSMRLKRRKNSEDEIAFWKALIHTKTGDQAITNSCKGWKQESASVFNPVRNRHQKDFSDTANLAGAGLFESNTQDQAQYMAEKLSALIKIFGGQQDARLDGPATQPAQ